MGYADRVVRDILPAMLDASGSGTGAQGLRGLGPLNGPLGAAAAVSALRALAGAAPEAWREVVADCSFWTEAAVLAALRNDASAFAHHVGRADRAMRQGLSLLAVH